MIWVIVAMAPFALLGLVVALIIVATYPQKHPSCARCGAPLGTCPH